MIQTHKGYAKDSYNEYEFEVLKQGHVYTLNVTRNGEELESVWCEDMSSVRKKIRRYSNEYKLEKVES